jgi:hypothetical protein
MVFFSKFFWIKLSKARKDGKFKKNNYQKLLRSSLTISKP